MSLKNRFMPYVARGLTSPGLRDLKRAGAELKRKLTGKPHRITFYFRVDDPYSWLLAQVLPEFAAHFNVEIEPRTMLYVDAQMYPALDMLGSLAPADAAQLARLHDLEFPADWRPPDPAAALAASRLLIRQEESPDYLALANELCAALWRGDEQGIHSHFRRLDADAGDKATLALQARRDQFLRDGHYLTGTLHYAGEWYWSMERLDHLAARLASLGLGDTASLPDYGLAKRAALTSGQTLAGTLEMFFSFRSPYSYLALARARQLADHYGLDLDIRPVLPMVMRGLAVPPAKKFYILHDAAREAALHQVPFGYIADPVGVGVERCMALWPFAEKEGRLQEYFPAAGRCIWSQGVDVATDAGLRRVCHEAGLDWNRARRWLDDDGWRGRAEENRAAMLRLGSWGVPTFHINGHCVWGQDRFAILEKFILEGAQQ